jgi:RNA polymerase sigma-70 factor (ECF subfamily)
MLRPARTAERRPDREFVVPTQVAVASTDAAFEALFRRHYRDVYRYVLALTRSAEDADDITAEAFEQAFRSWTSAGAVPASALPWLLLTARRRATDRWRRAGRLAALIVHRARRRHADAGERRTEFWLWFDAISRVLTDRQREVLLLRYQRDLSNVEIGSILGLSESGVRSLISRALGVLREHEELLR